MLVLTLIGISAISTTTYETNIAGNERLYNRSFYSADAGVDYFYATNSSYLYVPEKNGTFDSKGKGVDLGGDQFVITWQKLSEETGPPKKVEFLVISEGISPNLPNAGRVTIETISRRLNTHRVMLKVMKKASVGGDRGICLHLESRVCGPPSRVSSDHSRRPPRSG